MKVGELTFPFPGIPFVEKRWQSPKAGVETL